MSVCSGVFDFEEIPENPLIDLYREKFKFIGFSLVDVSLSAIGEFRGLEDFMGFRSVVEREKSVLEFKAQYKGLVFIKGKFLISSYNSCKDELYISFDERALYNLRGEKEDFLRLEKSRLRGAKMYNKIIKRLDEGKSKPKLKKGFDFDKYHYKNVWLKSGHNSFTGWDTSTCWDYREYLALKGGKVGSLDPLEFNLFKVWCFLMSDYFIKEIKNR